VASKPFLQYAGAGLLATVCSIFLVKHGGATAYLLTAAAGKGPLPAVLAWSKGKPYPGLATGLSPERLAAAGAAGVGVLLYTFCGGTGVKLAGSQAAAAAAPVLEPAPATAVSPAPAPAQKIDDRIAAVAGEDPAGRKSKSSRKARSSETGPQKKTSRTTPILRIKGPESAMSTYTAGKRARAAAMQAEPHQAAKHWKEAVAAFTRCLDIGGHPEPTKVLNQRGQCNERLARWEAAFLDYDEAIRSTPDLRAKGPLHSNRAKTHAALGRLQSAVDDFERAEQLGYTKARERLASLRQLQVSEHAKIVESGRKLSKKSLGAVVAPVRPPTGLDASDSRFDPQGDPPDPGTKRSRRKSTSRPRARSASRVRTTLQ
jgi:hypothetical protein